MTDPADVVAGTWGGETFRTGRRTAAHLDATFEAFARQFPNALLMVAQGSYNTSNPSSAGTHDFDAVVDFDLFGVDWWVAQRFLREHGWAAWFRHTGTWAARDDWHIHAVSLGCPGPVGVFVPGQISDYYAHAFGLKGQHDSGSDPSWFPPDIDSTTFDYPRWLRTQEDAMPYKDWPQADKDALVADVTEAVVAGLLEAEVRKATKTQNAVTTRRAWRESFEAVEK